MSSSVSLAQALRGIRSQRAAPSAGQVRAVAAVLPLLFLALSLTVFGRLVVETRAFPLDDSWIHQVVGDNLARHGVPFFSLHGQSSGSTSALWPFVIALNHAVFPSIPPAIFLFAVNFIFLASIAAALFCTAIDDGMSWAETAAISAAAVMSGNFVWLAITGMEHVAFVAFIVIGAALVLFRPDSTSRWRTTAGGICLGLAVTTRIEAIAFLPVFCAIIALQRRDRAALIRFVGPAMAGVAMAFAYNLWTSGALLPTTFSGRKWLTFRSVHVPWHASVTFMRDFLPAWAHALYPDGGLIALLAIVVSTLSGVFLAVRRKHWRLLVVGFLSLYLFLVYAVLMPSYGHGMRYVALPVLCASVFVVYGFVGSLRLVGSRTLPGSQVPSACALAICAVLGVGSLQSWATIGRAGIDHIAATHIRMGRWLAKTLPPGTTVASFDIGAIAWFSRLHVIDLGGLTDPGFVPYLFEGRSSAYLRAHRVRWLVLPSEHPTFVGAATCRDTLERQLALCDGGGLHKKPVVLFSSPEAVWRLGHQRTGHAMQAQKLYRLDWED